ADVQGRSALMVACSKGHLDVVNRLLQVPGIDPSVELKDGQGAVLSYICRRYQKDGEGLQEEEKEELQALRRRRAAIIITLLQHPAVLVPSEYYECCTSLVESHNQEVMAHDAMFRQLLLCTDDERVGHVRRAQAIR